MQRVPVRAPLIVWVLKHRIYYFAFGITSYLLAVVVQKIKRVTLIHNQKNELFPILIVLTLTYIKYIENKTHSRKLPSCLYHNSIHSGTLQVLWASSCPYRVTCCTLSGPHSHTCRSQHVVLHAHVGHQVLRRRRPYTPPPARDYLYLLSARGLFHPHVLMPMQCFILQRLSCLIQLYCDTSE